MSKKKPVGKDFEWPFAKYRQVWIAEADRITGNADSAYEEAAFIQSDSRRARLMKKSASLYEHASELYRRAGLGLLAREVLFEAADCWYQLGDEESCRQAESKAEEIDPYYEDEEDCDDDE